MFGINQSICNALGEFDEERAYDYIDDLTEVFLESREYQLFFLAYGSRGYSYFFLEFACVQLRVALPKLTERDFNEIVFGIFPRKVSTDAKSAAIIVAQLRAFFAFLYREYGLANAQGFCALLDENAERRLHDALSDPSNFGTEKSIVLQEVQSDFDMTTPEGMGAFMLEYNKRLLTTPGSAPPRNPLVIFDPGLVLPFESWTPSDHEHAKRERDKVRNARKAKRKARKKNRK